MNIDENGRVLLMCSEAKLRKYGHTIKVIDTSLYEYTMEYPLINLEEVGCNAFLGGSRNSLPKLQKVGYVIGFKYWRGSAPKLKSVAGREYWWAGKIEL